MAEVNQCDVYCPRKAFLAAAYREDALDAGPVRKLALAVAAGAAGVGQLARAASCPQRNVSGGTWQARQECITAVGESLVVRPLDASRLTEHEHQVLDPFFQ